MGIYISGVKGLPEQVQANKEDITTIKEEIAGIDFDAIRQLEAQVAENTQDINNLEASIGVQNQAINTLNNDVDALESKTQLMSYNSDYGMTDFANSIEVADDVYARNVRVEGDGSIVNTSQSGMHFKEGANDDTLTIANNDGATPHYLHFNADGTLDIDGNPVGKQYYWHHIQFDDVNYRINILTTRSTAFTLEDLALYLYGHGITTGGNASPIYLQKVSITSSENVYYLGVYSDDGTSVKYRREGGGAVSITSIVADNVYEA